jgi:hypothetical protein
LGQNQTNLLICIQVKNNSQKDNIIVVVLLLLLELVVVIMIMMMIHLQLKAVKDILIPAGFHPMTSTHKLSILSPEIHIHCNLLP